MENKAGAGRHAGAVGGKGFYIVLFLCAAVIGVSAWILLSDARTNVEELESAEAISMELPEVVVTMMPSQAAQAAEEAAAEEPAPAAEEPAEQTDGITDFETQPVFSETVTSYVWPVRGGIEVPYAVETLLYDSTLADWRTHDGIDVACELGTQVIAAAGGTVVDVYDDDLAGTTVEIDHANGVHTIYSNLAGQPPVAKGDIVTMGQVIGSVGGTALAETNEVAHLHFAMTKDGLSADPMEYLPDDLAG